MCVVFVALKAIHNHLSSWLVELIPHKCTKTCTFPSCCNLSVVLAIGVKIKLCLDFSELEMSVIWVTWLIFYGSWIDMITMCSQSGDGRLGVMGRLYNTDAAVWLEMTHSSWVPLQYPFTYLIILMQQKHPDNHFRIYTFYIQKHLTSIFINYLTHLGNP